jgi:hypothetical protein
LVRLHALSRFICEGVAKVPQIFYCEAYIIPKYGGRNIANVIIIIIISLLISPLLGHRPSFWVTHKEGHRPSLWITHKKNGP